MKSLHIITPVKDSIDTTLRTIDAVMSSQFTMPVQYTIYNDFSTPQNTATLEQVARDKGFEIVNMSDLTTHPSPNYLMVLRMARERALNDDAALVIVESDVTVRPDTLQSLATEAVSRPDCGIAAAVTVDEAGEINYPYGPFKDQENKVIDTRKHCSFCCSLLTPALLKAFDFAQLDPTKNWFDVTISHESLACGLHNYVFTTLPVLHQPHASRPWKKLKYKNPLLYYWRKFTRGFDKI